MEFWEKRKPVFDINQAVREEEARAQRDWQSFDAKGTVYLLGNRSLCFYKIGLTRNALVPEARWRTIQQNVPFDLDVLRYWFVSHAQSFERLLHYEFRANKIRGEWFRFKEQDLEAVVTKAGELASKVPAP